MTHQFQAYGEILTTSSMQLFVKNLVIILLHDCSYIGLNCLMCVC